MLCLDASTAGLAMIMLIDSRREGKKEYCCPKISLISQRYVR